MKANIFIPYLIGAFILLPACNVLFDGRENTIQARLGDSFVLSEGETAILEDGLRITFQDLKQDSRCPLRVDCFWEGEIQAVFRVRLLETDRSIEYKGFLSQDGANPLEEDFEGYLISLQRIDPYPEEGVSRAEVRATLRVARISIVD